MPIEDVEADGDDPDRERDPRAVQEARQHVVPERIGPEDVERPQLLGRRLGARLQLAPAQRRRQAELRVAAVRMVGHERPEGVRVGLVDFARVVAHRRAQLVLRPLGEDEARHLDRDAEQQKPAAGLAARFPPDQHQDRQHGHEQVEEQVDALLEDGRVDQRAEPGKRPASPEVGPERHVQGQDGGVHRQHDDDEQDAHAPDRVSVLG